MLDHPIKLYSAGGKIACYGANCSISLGSVVAVWFVCLCLSGIVSGYLALPHLRQVPARRCSGKDPTVRTVEIN